MPKESKIATIRPILKMILELIIRNYRSCLLYLSKLKVVAVRLLEPLEMSNLREKSVYKKGHILRVVVKLHYTSCTDTLLAMDKQKVVILVLLDCGLQHDI